MNVWNYEPGSKGWTHSLPKWTRNLIASHWRRKAERAAFRADTCRVKAHSYLNEARRLEALADWIEAIEENET